jgi:hypothetical protein
MDAYVIREDNVRPCGECRACCTTLGVEELHKRNYTPCKHECDQGCAINKDRPASCRSFNCWWKVKMIRGDRPDKSGVIVESCAIPGGAVVRVWEHIPGALNWKSNRKLVNYLRQKYSMVITGTKNTWGKLWVEDAPPQMKGFIQEMKDAGAAALEKVFSLLKKQKDDNATQ